MSFYKKPLENGTGDGNTVINSGVYVDLSNYATHEYVTNNINIEAEARDTAITTAMSNEVLNRDAAIQQAFANKKAFISRGWATDFDTATEQGIYGVTPTVAHIPSGAYGYGNLITFTLDNNLNRVQLYFPYQDYSTSTTNTGYYFRNQVGGQSSWTSWHNPILERDNNCVHITGTETVIGSKTFTDNTYFNGSVWMPKGTYYQMTGGDSTSGVPNYGWGFGNDSQNRQYLRIHSYFGMELWSNKANGGPIHLNSNVNVSGNIVATGDVTAYSDARLKSDIKDLEDRGPLHPVEYTKDGERQIGFIAQEVQEIYPETVKDDGKYLSVNYMALTAALQAQINTLKKEIEELKKDRKG